MGISGLLPFLKPISRQVHLRDFQGECIGIDAYSWLHKAVFSCSLDIMTGKPTRRYVDYCVKKIKLLQHHKIVPFLVFDGGNLPMKKHTENDRKAKREERRKLGFECLKAGNTQKATEYFQTCVDVTPEMAAELILTLKAMQIDFVVAPYEADAQLAYLNRIGTISTIISEDSDLLCFGCTSVIYKLSNDATAIEIRQQDFGKMAAMRHWTLERFRQMCIMSGCDYLASPPGIGVITAAKLLKKIDAYTVIKSWTAWGTAIKAPKLPPGYADMFRMAELTFLHQRVYDPDGECLVPLNPFPDGLFLTREISEAIGGDIEPHIAKGIALGLINPETKLEFILDQSLGPKIAKPPSFRASKIVAPLNARLYNTSTTMKLKAINSSPKEPILSSNFLKSNTTTSKKESRIDVEIAGKEKPLGQSKSDNTIIATDERILASPEPLSGATEQNCSTTVLKSFASVVKAGISGNKDASKKPVIISKHFPIKVDENREAVVIQDDEVQVTKVCNSSQSKSKQNSQLFSSGFPKSVQATPFKSTHKKPLQSKISHHFLKPTVPKLSPLSQTSTSKAGQVFTLKRPLISTSSLSNVFPSKKRFGLQKKKN